MRNIKLTICVDQIYEISESVDVSFNGNSSELSELLATASIVNAKFSTGLLLATSYYLNHLGYSKIANKLIQINDEVIDK